MFYVSFGEVVNKTSVFSSLCRTSDAAKILIVELKHSTVVVFKAAINRRKVDFESIASSSNMSEKRLQLSTALFIATSKRSRQKNRSHSLFYQLYTRLSCDPGRRQKKIISSIKDKYTQLWGLLFVDFCCCYCCCTDLWLLLLSLSSSSFKLPLKLSQCVQELILKLALFTLENTHHENLVDDIFTSSSWYAVAFATSNFEVFVKAAILPRYKSKLLPIHYGNGMLLHDIKLEERCEGRKRRGGG